MVYPHSYQHTQEANTLAGLQRAQRSNCPELVGYRVLGYWFQEIVQKKLDS